MDAPTAPQAGTNYEELVTFKVEDQLYKRPRSRIADSSDTFKEMLSAQGEHQAVIELSSCTKAEFESLLEVIYPKDLYDASAKLSKEQTVSVLKLSALWGMKEASDYAIETLPAEAKL